VKWPELIQEMTYFSGGGSGVNEYPGSREFLGHFNNYKVYCGVT
jgi:hypothetical protein